LIERRKKEKFDKQKPLDLLPEDGQSNILQKLAYWTNLCHLLSYLPNLRSLKLLIDSPQEAQSFYWLSEGFVSRLAALQNRTELSLIWLGTDSIGFESLMKLFFRPHGCST
jgi:hypothetical protein